ncbi:TPA: hypothetical protein ACH3X2_007496 [Trebouxia sp. C0005]
MTWVGLDVGMVQVGLEVGMLEVGLNVGMMKVKLGLTMPQLRLTIDENGAGVGHGDCGGGDDYTTAEVDYW